MAGAPADFAFCESTILDYELALNTPLFSEFVSRDECDSSKLCTKLPLTAEFLETAHEIISHEAAAIAKYRYGRSLRALILTGSLARREATVVGDPHNVRILGDVEFLLAFRIGRLLPCTQSISGFSSELENALRHRGVSVRVGASAVSPGYLRALPPEIFSFELLAFGQVLWGDERILDLIPRFTRHQVSKEDAWRLLCNRMIEVLEVLPEHQYASLKPANALHYRICKLYLDMATSFLVFCGAYEPTYRGRRQALEKIARTSNRHPGFSDLQDFARIVSRCCEYKMRGELPDEWFGFSSGVSCLRHAIETARALWRWELEQLANSSDTGDRELLRVLMHVQPLRRRARGWLSATRNCGLSGYRHWPRWARLALNASPRYLIYAAASELFFRVRVLDDGCDLDSLDMKEISSWLPLGPQAHDGEHFETWQVLTTAIAQNYHRLLETTRS